MCAREIASMVRLSPQEMQTLTALLEALGVPQKANCTARECVEAMLAIERKFGKNFQNDTAQPDQWLCPALASATSD